VAAQTADFGPQIVRDGVAALGLGASLPSAARPLPETPAAPQSEPSAAGASGTTPA
jgi:hypothetical protein